ncbi:MAG: PfkB family carbohydrate kinase [Planctomycetota bacterium]
MTPDLIAVGLAVADHLWLYDEPMRGTFHRAADYLAQGGGLAATAAVAMARLGGRVELWTRVGDDTAGRFILEQLDAEGVDTTQVQRCPDGRSPVCCVRVDRPQGERYFTFFPGRDLPPDTGGLDLGRVDEAKAVLVDGHWPEAQVPAARRASERGIPVVADLEPTTGVIDDLMPWVDYPIYARELVQARGGRTSVEESLRAVAELGGRVPMVTLGERGCLWLEEGKLHRFPAFEVEVVDTTGCGDVFHGAFAFGLARGWRVAENVRFASATAALKCRALGGRTGIPSYDEVIEFLHSRR